MLRSEINKGHCMVLSHLLLLSLLGLTVFAPRSRPGVAEPWAMIGALAIIQGLFLFFLGRRRRKGLDVQALYDIICFVWAVMILWLLATSVTHRAHPVLIPAPENVFFTFVEQGDVLALNVVYSMELLALGLTIGLVSAVLLGLAAGWYGRLGGFIYPIANVLAPIPPVVFSPYLVSIMPSFRSASVMVVILGVFWPTLLTTMNRVSGIDKNVLDTARMLDLSSPCMIFKVLLPYTLPGVVSGLKVSVTTSLLMLNFAELMGATHGMGYYVQNSITYANYTHAVAGIVVIGMVVTALSALVTSVQQRAIKWS